MFLRKAFLVFPSHVWAMNADIDGLSRSIRFLSLENRPVKPERTSLPSGVGDDAVVRARGAGEIEPEPRTVPALGAVENTQPRTVRAVLLNGESVGIFEVPSIRELRKNVAAARGVPPHYVDLVRGTVILEDSASCPDFVDGESVQVVQLSPVKALSRLVKEVQALDWKRYLNGRKDDRIPMKAKYWILIEEAVQSAFERSDNFSTDSEKCERPNYLNSGIFTQTTSQTPDCLKFRLETLESVWNSLTELALIRGFRDDDGNDLVPKFRDVLGGVLRNEEESKKLIYETQIVRSQQKGGTYHNTRYVRVYVDSPQANLNFDPISLDVGLSHASIATGTSRGIRRSRMEFRNTLEAVRYSPK